jgi:hypothetical protein
VFGTCTADFNIGSVLWFGARARGVVMDAVRAPITSPHCRYHPSVALTNTKAACNDSSTSTAAATATTAIALDSAPNTTAAAGTSVSTDTASASSPASAVAPAPTAASAAGAGRERKAKNNAPRVWVDQTLLTDEQKAERRKLFEGQTKMTKKQHKRAAQQRAKSATASSASASAALSGGGYRSYESQARVILNGIGADELV